MKIKITSLFLFMLFLMIMPMPLLADTEIQEEVDYHGYAYDAPVEYVELAEQTQLVITRETAPPSLMIIISVIVILTSLVLTFITGIWLLLLSRRRRN